MIFNLLMCEQWIYFVLAPDVNSKSALVPTSLGRGKEYFDEMYKDVQAKPTVSSSPSADTTKQSVNSKSSGHATNNMYTSRCLYFV